MNDFEMKYKGSELQALVEGSASSLFYAGTIQAAYSIPGLNGAQVTVSQAFRTKYAIGENKEVFYIVDKRMIAGDDTNIVYIYPADYEGCYFVMGDFAGNDAIFGLGATKGDWLVVQGREWVKIATQQREIAGISGNVTTEVLAQKLSTPTPTNTDPLAKQSSLNDFVRKDEAVDFATDLTGVVEATPEMFTYRPSAGDKSVRDESAVIRRIKGNTSVWAQWIKLALDQTDDNGWWFRAPEGGGNVRIEGNTVKYDVIADKGSNQQISQRVGFKVGHTYYLHFTFNNNGAVNDKWRRPWIAQFSDNKYGNDTEDYYAPQDSSTSGIVNIFHKVEKEGLQYIILRQPYIGLSNSEITPTVMEFGDIQLFDLTDLFGAGNEPTTYEEFCQYYPDAYYPYCAPEVRSMRATGIETVGFNQFNGVVMDGYIADTNGEHVENTNYKCIDYISVLSNQEYYINSEQTGGFWGAWYDSDKKFISGIAIYSSYPLVTSPTNAAYMRITIATKSSGGNPDTYCINLSHSGVRNGEYEPYEKNTLLLPEIAKYFPNGMHGIGDVYDEINEEMAIQRCAVRAYEEGDENNAEVKTDKITTVYKLSEPIDTPIDEPLQLAYKVDDFGTEKMLSDVPSSPFKADIVYQFNAEGRIRDNSRNIEKLEGQLQKAKEDIQNAGVQSDWLEDNPDSKAYIKNKPTMPTQVATAPEAITTRSVPSSMLPNIVYLVDVGLVRFTLPTLVDGDANAHNVWKIIFIPPASEDLTFPDNIAWKDGISPNWTEAGGYCELTFTKFPTSWILGEWKLYK